MGRSSTDRVRTAALAAFFALSLVRASASAAPGNQGAALEKFELGRAELQAERFESALAAFQASFELEKSPNSRLYIARCYRALGKFSSAYANYRLASAEAEDRVRATGEARYGATRDAANQEAEEIKPKLSSIDLGLPATIPADLSIAIDGVALSPAVLRSPVPVDPGAHVVKATGDRMRPVEVPVRLAAGEKKHVDIELVPIPTATIHLSWATKPSVFTASFDGKPLDPAALEKAWKVDVGEHSVVVASPGYQSFRWTKALADGETASVPIVLTPSAQTAHNTDGGTPKWLFFTVAGASVATLALGTVVYAMADSTVSEEKELDPLLRSASRRDDAESQIGVSRVLYGAGGALAVGAAVLFFTTSWKSPNASTKENAFLRPWIDRSAGGLSAQGRF